MVALFLICPLSEGVPALRRGEGVSYCTWIYSFLFLVYNVTVHLTFDGNTFLMFDEKSSVTNIIYDI